MKGGQNMKNMKGGQMSIQEDVFSEHGSTWTLKCV